MTLRCEEAQDRFSALWEKGLDPSEEAEVRGHVANCPECEREYARFDRTLRTLRSVEEVDEKRDGLILVCSYLPDIVDCVTPEQEVCIMPGDFDEDGHDIMVREM